MSDEDKEAAGHQARVPADSPLRCRVELIHPDKSTARCVLHKNHVLDDTRHLDGHGHYAEVLVHQSSVEDVRRIASTPFPWERDDESGRRRRAGDRRRLGRGPVI